MINISRDVKIFTLQKLFHPLLTIHLVRGFISMGKEQILIVLAVINL